MDSPARDLAILGIGAALGAAVAYRLRSSGEGLAPSSALPRSADGESEAYEPPAWMPACTKPPPRRLRLAQVPSPLHKWRLPGAPDTEIWIERDDYTGSELSGNKLRKLEFLLAEALRLGCDSVVTIGAVQSNHCRATAAAARRVGLEPFILLKVQDTSRDPGLVGNLLVDRLVGAQIRLVSQDDPRTPWELVCAVRAELEEAGRKPYGFPTGGSNAVGGWGYVETVRELIEQQAQSASGMPRHFDRVYFTCGSAGTAAGLALAMHFGGTGGTRAVGSELVALDIMNESPEALYKKLGEIFCDMGLPDIEPRRLLRFVKCRGDGYAVSREPELRFVHEAAMTTGVILDPVYTGKAAFGMVQDLQASPAKSALFIHTGGLLGAFGKSAEIAPLLATELVKPFQSKT